MLNAGYLNVRPGKHQSRSMEKSEFLKQHHLSLCAKRQKRQKDRIFKTVMLLVWLLPFRRLTFLFPSLQNRCLQSRCHLLNIGSWSLALVGFSENNALRRCGRYLKHHIET